MFKKLFKPKWQSAKSHVRVQAVAQLNPADIDDLHIIEVLAKNDLESEVRLAASLKIDKQQTLIGVIQQEKDPVVRIKMIEHLLQLMSTGDDLDKRVEKLVLGLDTQALATIVESTKSAPLGLLALKNITDEALLANYAKTLTLSALRQAAAEKVSDESLLEAIEKASKGKDKSVFRIARTKLQSKREALKKEENLEQQIDSICLSMEQLARTSDDPMFATKVEHWHKQWTRIEMHAAADDGKRFNRAYEICRQFLDSVQQVEEAQKEVAQNQRAAMQERMAACEQLEGALAQLKEEESVKPDEAPALSALLKTQKNRWEEAATESVPANDERKRFNRTYSILNKALIALQLVTERGEELLKASTALANANDMATHELLGLKKKLDRVMLDLDWPQEVPMPEEIILAQKAKRSFETLRQQAQQKESEAIGKFKSLLDKLDSAIKEGQLKPANKLMGDAQKWLKHIPSKSAQPYQKELRSYMARVNELRDWQGYAVLPKKQQLCDDMEALVGNDMDPQELANRIKRMQSEWKSLGYAKEGQELWERFSEAAEKAYEPCKAYFENLSGVRAKNLASRKQLVAQLADYLEHFNFNQADWVAVNQVYQTAKQEWRQYTPVERKEGKTVQNQFNDLLDKLRSKLAQEWDGNKRKRESLIEQAEALIAADDLNGAIEQAKSLQRQWKETGMVSRRDENRLWKQFRAACDKVFERRDKEREQASVDREKNLAEANHVVELIEHLSESESLTLVDSQKEFRNLQQRFNELGALPRENHDEVQKRYAAVCEHFLQGVKVAQAAAQKAQLATVWQKMTQLDELESKCVEQTQLDLLADDVNLELEHSDLKQGLQHRYSSLKEIAAGGDAPAPGLLDSNKESLRDLCIQLEITAGVESPSEDQQQRMALQVARLSNGMGQREKNRGDINEQVIKLQQQWCEVGPTYVKDRSKYTQRFVGVLKKIGEL